MITTEVRLYEGVEPVLRELSSRHRLVLITKGDLSHQQSKVAQSGLRQYFHEVNVVPVKNREIYAGILEKTWGSAVALFNDRRFHPLGHPAGVGAGRLGIYVPNDDTWTHEKVEPPKGFQDRYFEVENLGMLPACSKNSGGCKNPDTLLKDGQRLGRLETATNPPSSGGLQTAAQSFGKPGGSDGHSNWKGNPLLSPYCVAVIELEGELEIGSTVSIQGHTTDLVQQVVSLEINHQKKQKIGPGWKRPSRSMNRA